MYNNLLVKDIKFSYGQSNILSNINFNCGNGVIALLGNNGAGKTTLMNILSGLKKVSHGQVLLNDIELLKNRKYIVDNVGYLPQNFDVFKQVTGYDFLSYVYDVKNLNVNDKKSYIDDIVYRFNLNEMIKKPVGKYSGGYKKRLGIAQAIIGDPKLIIVDEPTAELDPEQRLEFRRYLQELGNNKIIIISTHIIEDVELYCSKLIILKKGEIIFDGTPDNAIKIASRHIFEKRLTLSELNKFQYMYKIIEERRIENDYIKVKFIADAYDSLESLSKGGVTLENAYIYHQK
ncbi:ATP-binding cassette domain-containing protein [Clostridium ihumii]|uniref:ATP-binding cassette domain-containing protein n=1 Tax=Clostridium ihumii TaxID=1470356 RepID=UPI00058BE542|nr:ATP-binding cassette domain-containing protein [Clostridium ihumii]